MNRISDADSTAVCSDTHVAPPMAFIAKLSIGQIGRLHRCHLFIPSVSRLGLRRCRNPNDRGNHDRAL